MNLFLSRSYSFPLVFTPVFLWETQKRFTCLIKRASSTKKRRLFAMIILPGEQCSTWEKRGEESRTKQSRGVSSASMAIQLWMYGRHRDRETYYRRSRRRNKCLGPVSSPLWLPCIAGKTRKITRVFRRDAFICSWPFCWCLLGVSTRCGEYTGLTARATTAFGRAPSNAVGNLLWDQQSPRAGGSPALTPRQHRVQCAAMQHSALLLSVIFLGEPGIFLMQSQLLIEY